MKKAIVQPPSLLKTTFPHDQCSPREEFTVHPTPFAGVSPFDLVAPWASAPATEPSSDIASSPYAVVGQSPLPLATAPLLGLFPPLEKVTRPTVSTSTAAYYLNRKPQTLRAWACLENGPLRPVRINGRLAWSVSAIRALVNGEAK
jgi:hypothetical protein